MSIHQLFGSQIAFLIFLVFMLVAVPGALIHVKTGNVKSYAYVALFWGFLFGAFLGYGAYTRLDVGSDVLNSFASPAMASESRHVIVSARKPVLHLHKKQAPKHHDAIGDLIKSL